MLLEQEVVNRNCDRSVSSARRYDLEVMNVAQRLANRKRSEATRNSRWIVCADFG